MDARDDWQVPTAMRAAVSQTASAPTASRDETRRIGASSSGRRYLSIECQYAITIRFWGTFLQRSKRCMGQTGTAIAVRAQRTQCRLQLPDVARRHQHSADAVFD